MIISFQPVILEVPWAAPGRKAWRYSRSAGKVRALGHVDGGGEQQQKTHSFSQSVFAGAEVYVSTCACGRCACVCVCGGGGQQNTTSLLLLRVSKSHRVPGDSASGAALWATSRLPLPPPAVTICTNRDLPKPSPAHTSSQNIRTSHQLTLAVKTQFTAKEHEISGPHCRGAAIIHTQWCRTPKPHSTPGTGTRWQKGLLSSLMVERWRGPSARKGLKSHIGWEICTKGVLFVLCLSSTAGPVGLRVPSFTVAQLPRAHNREEERGRQSPPQAHKWEKDGFSWLTQTGSRGYLGMEPPGRLIWNASKRLSCFKELAPMGQELNLSVGRGWEVWNSCCPPTPTPGPGGFV